MKRTISLLLCIAVLLWVSACGLFAEPTDAEEITTTVALATNTTKPTTVKPTTARPVREREDWEDLKFTIMGKELQLPCDLAELEDITGLKYKEFDDLDEFITTNRYGITDGKHRIALQVGESKVTQIGLTKAAMEHFQFTAPGDVTANDTKESIKNKFKYTFMRYETEEYGNFLGLIQIGYHDEDNFSWSKRTPKGYDFYYNKSGELIHLRFSTYIIGGAI